MRSNIFSSLVKNNILWFLLEIISAYIAAKALVLGNNKISDAMMLSLMETSLAVLI